MKIKSLKASGVYGRFSYDLKFNDDLSLITGTNGKGKTTALKLIASLLTPDFEWLFSVIVEKATVVIENQSKKIKITFQNDGESDIQLTYSGKNTKGAKFSFSQEDAEAFLDPRRYRGRILRDSTYAHIVVEKISALPSPMYLSLERKNILDWHKLEAEEREGYLRANRNGAKGKRIISVNVDDAVRLVNSSVRKMENQNKVLTDQLSRDLLLTPYLAEPTSSVNFPQLMNTIDELLNIQDNIIDAYTLLGVRKTNLKKSAGKFFAQLKKQKADLPASLSDENSAETHEAIEKMVRIMSLGPRINILREHSKLVNKYQEEAELLFQERTIFLHALNLFFKSSDLNASFEHSDLKFKSQNGEEINPHHLSSGEKQIFMLLSHLMFNPQGAESSVIVIDEPELSLHIEWQEIFSDSILEVRPDLQAIFATHSPSIIGDKVEKCLTL